MTKNKAVKYPNDKQDVISGDIIGLDNNIDPKLLSMAGTISMPTPEELEADPRLKEAFGKS